MMIFGSANARATSIPLYSFNGSDGESPYAGLVRGIDGNFYGTTYRGGTTYDGQGTGIFGTVFKMTPAGSLTTLYSFSGSESDGSGPRGVLVQGSDDDFYGTTSGERSGLSGNGTVFKITPGGSLTTLHHFSGNDGANPYAGLVRGNDGDFYGTTFNGGASGSGTVFKITSGGNFTTLYHFSGTDGARPVAGIVQGSDGNFYGTTANGGAGGSGTVFKMTSGGNLTTLYNFSGYSDGGSPYAGLVQGKDGNFYGTTNSGGTATWGTVFEITPDGSLTTLHNFNYYDGGTPWGRLVQGSDGNFYGTTLEGGVSLEYGTVFKITAGGNFTTLYNFSGNDGYYSYAGLLQDAGGNFYGTTFYGGESSLGTVFKITVTIAPGNVDQCKNGGWVTFNSPRTFKNQGDCIQLVNTGR